jgi:hypothetical protein
VIPAALAQKHHADVEFPFRQDSDFWYLTGFLINFAQACDAVNAEVP